MLHIKFTDWMVDIACYVQLVQVRTLFAADTDAGETYRKRIGDPAVISLIDGWGKALLADVEQAVWSDDDPKVVMNEGKKKLVQGIIRSLPVSRIVDFANKLTREMDSPQFAMELQKIKLSPNFLAFGLTVAEVSGIALPENTETSIEKSLLQHIGNNTAPDALFYERKRQALDDMVSLAQSVPQTLHKMGQEVQEAQIMNREWPWKLPRNMLAGRPDHLAPPDTPLLFRALYDEAEKRAKRKIYRQKQKAEAEQENLYGNIEEAAVKGSSQQRVSIVVRFENEVQEVGVQQARDAVEDAILNRVEFRRRCNDIAGDIRHSFRSDKAQHCLRLLNLFYKNLGEIPPQNVKTAATIGVKLRALQGLIAEFHQRGWFPGS